MPTGYRNLHTNKLLQIEKVASIKVVFSMAMLADGKSFPRTTDTTFSTLT